MNTESLVDQPVAGFLDAVASREPAPGGGAVAAVTAASAAALVAMAARFSTGELAELAGAADELRAELTPLADADADAYGSVLAAYRLPRDQADRRDRITASLRTAAQVPLRIVAGAAQVGVLAQRLAAGGNPNLIGDARTAALLAEAAAAAAAGLVTINVDAGDLERSLCDEAEALVRTARNARHAALGEEAAP